MLPFNPIPPLDVPSVPIWVRYYADLYGDHYSDNGFTTYFYGNDRFNIFHGDERSDVFFGRGGNDWLFGHGGNDILNGDDGDDYLSGGDGNDFIYGGDGDDRSYGGSGNDILRPGMGDDDAYGGLGDDTFIAGLGRQYYNGGSGNDTVSYAEANRGIGLSLDTGATWTLETRGDRFVSIENVIGTEHRDDIRGDAGDNVLHGLGGRDYISGGGGDDQIVGGKNDPLQGDILRGGAGNDFFYFYEGDSGGSSGQSADRIQDFEGAISPSILADALFFEVNDADYAEDNWLAVDYLVRNFEWAGTVIAVMDRDDTGEVYKAYEVILEGTDKDAVADWQIVF
ncbi:MAG: calcium-binding protein [Pseudomonadota bacterium]